VDNDPLQSVHCASLRVREHLLVANLRRSAAVYAGSYSLPIGTLVLGFLELPVSRFTPKSRHRAGVPLVFGFGLGFIPWTVLLRRRFMKAPWAYYTAAWCRVYVMTHAFFFLPLILILRGLDWVG